MTHYSVTVFIYSVTVFIIAFSHCPSRPNADSRGLSPIRSEPSRGLSNCTLSIVKLSIDESSILSGSFAASTSNVGWSFVTTSVTVTGFIGLYSFAISAS